MSIEQLGAAIAALAAIAVVGCGDGSTGTVAAGAAGPRTARAICEQGSRELVAIDNQPARTFGAIDKAARASDRVDAHTEAQLRAVRPSSSAAAPLAYLRHTRAVLQRWIAAGHQPADARPRQPRLVATAFLQANSGCGVVHTRKPIGG